MINERLKKRLKKDRPSTTITMRIPADVVESLKSVAPMRGFTAYQTLLKSYISEGLRRDEAQFDQYTARRLADALKRRGVTEKVLQEAMKEIAESSCSGSAASPTPARGQQASQGVGAQIGDLIWSLGMR